MRKMTGLMVTALCFAVLVQTSFAAPKKITGDDITFKKMDMDLTLADYNDNFPTMRGIASGGTLRYPMLKLEYEWALTSAAKKRHKDSAGATGDFYIDNMEFEWRVILAKPSKGTMVRGTSGRYNINPEDCFRMKKKIRYANVSSKGTHYSVVFLDPRMVDRLFKRFVKENVFIELVIKIEGKEAARLNSHGKKSAYSLASDGEKGEKDRMKYYPRRRSTEPTFFLSEKVREQGGVLMAKHETPFAFSHMNVFETTVVPEGKE
jgi:hypothetical protein